MFIDYEKCRRIGEAQRANYWYLTDQMIIRLIGTICAIRRKDVDVAYDIQPAIVRRKIPFEQQKGYRQAAADYFGTGPLVKHGSTYGPVKRKGSKQLALKLR